MIGYIPFEMSDFALESLSSMQKLTELLDSQCLSAKGLLGTAGSCKVEAPGEAHKGGAQRQ